VRVSYGLPTHRVDRADEFLSSQAVAELAGAAEAAGFGAVYSTEHPFPVDTWLAKGGHQALDPLIALGFAAAATTTLLLHTNLFIAAYRNPFLAARSIATLDVLSGGRVVLGIGAGYLEGEFAALGMSFDDRNERTDAAIVAMKAAWSGESVTMDGPGFAVRGNTMLPRPRQRPHPPLWIGGNSRRAIRRAVDLADGWSPFPVPAKAAARIHTAPLRGLDELAAGMAYARAYGSEVGRQDPLELIFIPSGFDMPRATFDPGAVLASCRELAELGVTWITVALPGESRDEQLAAIEHFGRTVVPALDTL
jgi:probable F420-dependent oxidoreductase